MPVGAPVAAPVVAAPVVGVVVGVLLLLLPHAAAAIAATAVTAISLLVVRTISPPASLPDGGVLVGEWAAVPCAAP